MIKKRHRLLKLPVLNLPLRNKQTGFTIIELLIVMTLMCMGAFSAQHLYVLYGRVMLSVASDQLTATCCYLSSCARANGKQTSLLISGERSYCINDGLEHKECVLPWGVSWGAPTGVYGPPSRPKQLIKKSVIGGLISNKGTMLVWDTSGASTPATCYMYSGADCCAVSMSRARVGRPSQWILRAGLWQIA